MRHRLWFGVMLCCIVAMVATNGRAADPITAPATRPVEVGEYKKLLMQLGDSEDVVRTAARLKLMSAPRSALPVLRDAVKQVSPVSPALRVTLKEIITQIYLAGDYYEPQENGFLGIRLPTFTRPEHQALLSIERGVAVVGRIPGFCAYRMLQDGDVIITITSRQIKAEVNSSDQLKDVVKAATPGDTLDFEIIRDGKIIAVQIKLDPFPTRLLAAANSEEFEAERHDRASEYWTKEFAPLMEEDSIG